MPPEKSRWDWNFQEPRLITASIRRWEHSSSLCRPSRKPDAVGWEVARKHFADLQLICGSWTHHWIQIYCPLSIKMQIQGISSSAPFLSWAVVKVNELLKVAKDVHDKRLRRGLSYGSLGAASPSFQQTCPECILLACFCFQCLHTLQQTFAEIAPKVVVLCIGVLHKCTLVVPPVSISHYAAVEKNHNAVWKWLSLSPSQRSLLLSPIELNSHHCKPTTEKYPLPYSAPYCQAA